MLTIVSSTTFCHHFLIKDTTSWPTSSILQAHPKILNPSTPNYVTCTLAAALHSRRRKRGPSKTLCCMQGTGFSSNRFDGFLSLSFSRYYRRRPADIHTRLCTRVKDKEGGGSLDGSRMWTGKLIDEGIDWR